MYHKHINSEMASTGLSQPVVLAKLVVGTSYMVHDGGAYL